MKKIFLASFIGFALLGSCQQQSTKDATQHQQFADEAIKIHDEIMPQISSFDRATLKIDSILENLASLAQKDKSLDTAVVKSDLEALKTNLEDATDNMMTWMKDYDATSTDDAYQQKELDKITTMQKQFENVNSQINKSLTPFN